MTTDPAIEALKARVAGATLGAEAGETGLVVEIADGLAHVSGLPGARLGEVLVFPGGARALVLTLGEGRCGGLARSRGRGLRRSFRIAHRAPVRVPVGEGLLGRVVDPLGRPLDGLGTVAAAETWAAEHPAPGSSSATSSPSPWRPDCWWWTRSLPSGGGSAN